MSSKLNSNFLQFKFAVGKSAKQSIYVFDEYRLDADTLMLYRGDEPLMLPPKVVKTLTVLVENRGEILSKDEILDKVWEDSIVEESNLSQNLYLLRKTLGPRPDGTPYIETLRRRGYRFTADYVAIEPPPTNGATPLGTLSTVHRQPIARRGNVVALVDWKDADETVIPANGQPPAAEVSPPVPAVHRASRWLLTVALATVPMVALAIWLGAARPPQVAPESDRGLSQPEVVQLTNDEDVADATISADGKYFTYHEVDGEFSRMVVRQTGQTQKIEVLPKTPRAIFGKTFSPDGQFIFYLAQDAGASHASIYRVPTMGGIPVKIVENANSYPSFSPDGLSMVFHRSDQASGVTSLYLAGIDGTGEKTILSAGGAERMQGFPAWSPDGKSIAYALVDISRTSTGSCSLMAYELETRRSREISTEKWDTCYRIEWKRDGRGIVMIGTRAGEGMTIHRDQVYFVSLPDGRSKRLVTDTSRYQIGSLGITQNDEVIAVPFSRTSQLWVMDPGGSAKTATSITAGASDGRAGLVPLPDGRIAFTSRTGENLGGWTVDADGSNKRQLTTEPPIIEELRATPDAKYFFFAAPIGERHHIFRVDTDGSNLKQITTGDSSESDSSVSPDGKWLVYHSLEGADLNRQFIWRTSIDGGAPTQLSTLPCTTPNYSPTGKFISCVWGNDIFVLSSDDGSLVRRFTAVKVPSLNVGAKWTPDERTLVYISTQKGTTNLWLQPLDGKQPRQLTDFPNGSIYNFAYSRDGSKLYLARGFQNRDAILIKGL